MRRELLLASVIVIICIGILISDSMLLDVHNQATSQQRIESIKSKVIQTIAPPAATPIPTPNPDPLPPETVVDVVNKARIETGGTSLRMGNQTCTLLDTYITQKGLTNTTITKLCPTCQRVNIVSLTKHSSVDALRQFITTDPTAQQLVTDNRFTHYCIQETQDAYVIAVVVSMTPKPSPEIVPVTSKSFTEEELWNALVAYRQSHRMADLTKDEKLCQYARKRVNDHLQMIADKKSPDTYPNPSKYPLDAHEGFRKDADTGYVFEVTEKQAVAENLAYWPNATYATHVIEWGWDTSTEGHRETQLSNDYPTACLSGKDGFYVAIYGR